MKALTLSQPFASLWAAGIKSHETRGRRWSYRGPVAIHAGATLAYTKGEEGYQSILADPIIKAAVETLAGVVPWSDPLPRGYIIAVLDLIDGRPTESIAPRLSEQERTLGNYAPGRWAYLASRRRLLAQPIPSRGYQGLWVVPPELEQQIRAQLGG